MRKLFVIAFLSLVLAVLIVAMRAASDLRAIASAEPGVPWYATGFEDNAAGWSVYDDGQLTSEIADGHLTLTVDAAQTGAFSLLPIHTAHFDVRVQTTALAGPIDNAFGIVFRAQTNDNLRVTDDSFYVFWASSDGYYRVTKTLDGAERVISDWIASDAIATGLNAPNMLRVVAVGDVFSFFVNDRPLELCIPNDPDGISTPVMGTCLDGSMVTEWSDGSLGEGQLGVIAQSTVTGGPGVRVAFDRWVVLGA